MDTNLRGRSAVITGASKGIGKGIARCLAREGVNVILLARNEPGLSKTAAEIESEFGVATLSITADVTDTPSLRRAAAKVAENATFGKVNIVVNNAGGPIARQDRQIEWPDEEWQKAVDIKTLGALRMTREFLGLLPKDGTGRIINVAGASGISAWMPALMHGINNAALIHATGYLAADLAGQNVTVNAIVPCLVGTEFRQEWATQMAKQAGKTQAEAIATFCESKGILFPRWADVEEIGDLAVFLASDRAAYITGAKIPIDGGFSANFR